MTALLERHPAPMAAPAIMPRRGDTLAPLRALLIGAVAVSAGVQWVFHSDQPNNALATALVLATSLIGFMHTLRTERFRAAPVSALAILFFTLTSSAGALMVKTMERSALVDRLSEPTLTFGVLLASQVALLLADVVYQRSRLMQRARHLLTAGAHRLTLLQWPPDLHLWLMGLFGLFAAVVSGSDHESAASFGAGTALAKLLRAFQILKFAPFLIPFRNACSGTPARFHGSMYVPLAGYFCLLVGASFLTNSRSTFADSIPTIGVCLLLALGYGAIRPSQLKPGRLIFIAVVLGLAALILSRVALAMVVARDYRYFVDASALVQLTIEALFNSEWLEAARAKMESTINVADYSETYVDSRFFSRFLMTKFHDNILYYGGLLGADQVAQYQQFVWDRLWATLPDPALRALGINIDKSELVISNGDYMIYLADGWGLGQFKTGSMFGELFTLYGWGFPLVLVAVSWLLFVAYDAFAALTPEGRLVISPLLLLLAWNLVGTTAAFGFGSETWVSIIAGVARGIPQNLLVYLMAAWGLRLLFGRR